MSVESWAPSVPGAGLRRVHTLFMFYLGINLSHMRS